MTTLDRMEILERTLCEIDEKVRLVMPLVEIMLPRVKHADSKGMPRAGRYVKLSKRHFREQFEAGITTVLGINIVWV
ncbi:MAG: hypothetical protein C4586_08375 [Anaerolineaceae bacterium]|nr:MAG: hypothetical protein C4586_08375 [Anaerolineaceae bacterium]